MVDSTSRCISFTCGSREDDYSLLIESSESPCIASHNICSREKTPAESTKHSFVRLPNPLSRLVVCYGMGCSRQILMLHAPHWIGLGQLLSRPIFPPRHPFAQQLERLTGPIKIVHVKVHLSAHAGPEPPIVIE